MRTTHLLRLWVREEGIRLKELGLTVEVNPADSGSATCQVVLEGPRFLASISAWDLGAMDVDVISAGGGQTLWTKRFDVADEAAMEVALVEVTQKLERI